MIKNPFKNYYNFFKLVKLLRGWKKYESSQYDGVVDEAFTLINAYDLKPGKRSPKFSLPNDQLDEEFIIKFFERADSDGYHVVSYPCVDRETHTTFYFKN